MLQKFRFAFSRAFSSTSAAIYAAPQLNSLGLKGPAGIHPQPSPSQPPERELPSKLSFFTGKATFYESLFFLQQVSKNAPACPPGYSAPPSRQFPSKTRLSETLKCTLSDAEYLSLKEELLKLHDIAHFTLNSDIKSLLDSFGFTEQKSSTLQPSNSQDAAPALFRTTSSQVADEYGRVWAIGRRKTSVAKVWMIKGEGNVMVNGMKAPYFFSKVSDLMKLLNPFLVTKTLASYNIWAVTLGGGSTGQSGAVALGIAKALCLLNPELKETLDAHGLLIRDPRMVERKKPGKAKARKSFTWY